MSITIVKTKTPTGHKVTMTKNKPVQSIATPAESQTVTMVAELIALHTKLTSQGAFAAIKRLDELKKGLQEVMAESAVEPTKPYVFTTVYGTVEFGPCSSNTVVTDREAMIKALTLPVFKSIAKVGVTDLKTYLSANEIESFTEKTNGSRSLKSVKQ